jgi:hypothetical protein
LESTKLDDYIIIFWFLYNQISICMRLCSYVL